MDYQIGKEYGIQLMVIDMKVILKTVKKKEKELIIKKKSLFKADRYEGDYWNNKQDGKGIIYFSNSDSYEGDLKNG